MRIEADPIAIAAAELFEKRGYERTTVSAIAERSGYARQTIYARYRHKPALLEAVVVEFFRVFPRYVMCWEAEQRDRSAPPTGQPFPVSLVMSALESFCASCGPLARVALACRDLPWMSSRAREACRELTQLLRYHLAAPDARDAWLTLCIDLLKQAALRRARGGATDPSIADALAALMGHSAPARPRSAASAETPSGPDSVVAPIIAAGASNARSRAR